MRKQLAKAAVTFAKETVKGFVLRRAARKAAQK